MRRIVCPNCRCIVTAELKCPRCDAPLARQSERSTDPAAPRDQDAIDSASIAALEAHSVDVIPDLDPRLQRAVARAEQSNHRIGGSSRDDEIAVIAKVTDIVAWKSLPGVRVFAELEGEDDHTVLTTARIPVMLVKFLRQQPFVKSLKAAQRLRPQLNKTVEETGAHPDLLPSGNRVDGGRDVIVGIVDFGFDFAHENFRNPDGSSRALAIWNQNGEAKPDSPFGYGRLHRKPEIDAAFLQPDPYQALGYGPFPDTGDEEGRHGTHVSDIAAGNGRGTHAKGVAPNADIIFVELSLSDVSAVGKNVVNVSLGDSVRLAEALKFIFSEAGDRPCVVNVSLGTNGGPHDGTTLVEQWIERLIDQKPNRAVTIAAGNFFEDGIHATGVVPQDGTFDLLWQISRDDLTDNELEIWYSGNDQLTVELIAPDCSSKLTVKPGRAGSLKADDQVVLHAVSRLKDPSNRDNVIGVFLASGLPAGVWTVRLHGESVVNGRFHAWIERDPRGVSRFVGPNDNSYTLGSISCGLRSIVAGSYDAHQHVTPIFPLSSAGPTRDNRSKPEVSAPGVQVLAAHSGTKTGFIRKDGTSMASAAAAGIVALMFAEAKKRGISLTIDQVRQILIKKARKNPPTAAGFDPQFGNGRISADAAVAEVIALAQPPAPPIDSAKIGSQPLEKMGAGSQESAQINAPQ